MKTKLTMIFLTLIVSAGSSAASNPLQIADEAATLTRILGEEFVARHSEELDYCLSTESKECLQNVIDKVRKEVASMSCFDIADFFGNPMNALPENREFNMGLWTVITRDCSDIIMMLEPHGGLEEQVASYLTEKYI